MKLSIVNIQVFTQGGLVTIRLHDGTKKVPILLVVKLTEFVAIDETLLPCIIALTQRLLTITINYRKQ